MRVLIADDEEIERTTLGQILRAEPGIEVVEVTNGQQALDRLCEGSKIHLCLVDIRMPEVDGLQLLQRIRRDPLLRDHHVIITSGNRDKTIIVALAQLGISGYLLKPYDPEKVRALVKQVQQKMQSDDLGNRDLLAKTLLVVDDDAELRQMLANVALLEPGWKVVEAQDGEQALKLLHQGLRPQLCFCDIKMPKLDGIGFVQRVREDSSISYLPIVMISAEHSAQEIRLLAEFRISGYMVKPFDVAKVRAFLKQASGAGGLGLGPA